VLVKAEVSFGLHQVKKNLSIKRLNKEKAMMALLKTVSQLLP
jgi:hypothetical protein